MRITNKMMTNNSLGHINTVKGYEDNLTTQMSTGKKISRASEDPVIAIRALRLRSSVTETTQYYKYNASDAKQWLSITESSLDDTTDLIAEAIKNMEKGANSYLQSSDRVIIADQLDAIVDEIYTAGNADYAGRYIFTGYRTDTSLSYTGEEEVPYTITEFFNKADLEVTKNISTASLEDITKANYKTISLEEQQVETSEFTRVRLAYDNLTTEAPSDITLKNVSSSGEVTYSTISVEVKSVKGLTDAQKDEIYAFDGMDSDKAYYIPETGELLLGKDAVTEVTKAEEFSITYHKDHFVKGDLRPEHYFACSAIVEGEEIEYNIKRDEDTNMIKRPEEQVITYDVGANQNIRVNSNAAECYTHDLGNAAKELRDALEKLQKIENQQTVLADLKASTTDPDELAKIETLSDAAQKAFDLQKDKVQETFEKSIAHFQAKLDKANLALTSCGTRSSKLELISTRLQSQKTQTEELKSQNEDADITETAVNLTSANTTYEAALMATSKIMQTSLLNYL